MNKHHQQGSHEYEARTGNKAAHLPPLEDDDDLPIGRVLSRREILRLFGTTGGALVVAACAPIQQSMDGSTLPPEGATAASPTVQAEMASESATAVAINEGVELPACIVRPEVTEGPYYVDVDLLRSDIREDKEGAPLYLTFKVTEVSDSTCTPLEGAVVEIWHCDVYGAYSGVTDPGFDTSGETWLRGGQITDANGVANITTIYPGWYSSRAVHIHFKIHPTEELVFTSQLFFPDDYTEQVYAVEPYASEGLPDTLNSTDNIYQELLLLDPTETEDGYAAVFNIGIDMSTIGTGERSRPSGGPPPGYRGG